jgi:hypothetical protein
MLRELTLNVEENLYNSLMPMVEKQTIGNLLAEFVQARLPHRTYTQMELEAGYKAMAADTEYEREAMEWCNGTIGKLMADQIMTADKGRLKKCIGVLSSDDMAKVEDTVRMHLGL